MTLYEIDKAISDCIDEETGEILDFDKLDKLQMDRTAKIENVVAWIENLKNHVAGLEEQEQIFKARKQKAKAEVEGLKTWLSYALNGQRFETVKAKVTFRKSESVAIEDESILPSEYWKTVTTQEPDITAIKEALKAGKSVSGAKLEERLNPQINPARRAK